MSFKFTFREITPEDTEILRILKLRNAKPEEHICCEILRGDGITMKTWYSKADVALWGEDYIKANSKMKYIDGMKQKEIAEVLGVSVNTVNRCDHNATGRLRRQESRTWHRYYSTIYLKAAVGHHVGVKAFQNTWTSEVEREALRRMERQEERKRKERERERERQHTQFVVTSDE